VKDPRVGTEGTVRLSTVVLALLIVGAFGATSAHAARRPDLAVAKPGGVPASATAVQGFRASVLARNVGRARSKRTVIAFFLSKDRKRSAKDLRFARELALGKLRSRKRSRKRGRVVIPPDAASGRWFVLACADPDRVLREAKEGNNCAASRAVRVRGANPLKAAVTRHEEGAVDQPIVSGGDTIDATGPDGTLYRLSLGATEAANFTSVKLTPLTVAVPASGGVTPQGAVLIEPADRLLPEGATLSIYPPDGASPRIDRLLGFASAADGSEFHLHPAAVELDGAVDIEVLEFGVFGYGTAPATASVAQSGGSASGLSIPSAIRHQFAQKAAEILRRGEDVTPVACDYFSATVLPRLRLAARAGNRQQVSPVIQDALWIMRLAGVAGKRLDGGCFDEAYGLFRSILDRLFNEAYTRCEASGGDPFVELPEMILVWRWQQLLGAHDESTNDDKSRKVAECISFQYEASYQTQHQTLTTGGWASTGSASGTGLRFPLAHPQTIRQSMSVPAPSAQFSSECAGSFLNSSGEYGVRSWLISEERYVGRFVNGRYKPDAELKIEFKLKIRFHSTVDATFRIDCGAGDGLWDLGGDQYQAEAILPVRGGSATATTGTLEPADDCVECQRATGTISVQTVSK
jgi:hypothetical protein